MDDRIDDVLTYWIEDVGWQGWWTTNADIDAAIARRFGALSDEAAAGGLNHWQASASGSLALIVLTDQFRRNLHRGTARAFAADALALRIAKSAISRGQDMATAEPGRMFFYLPLEHSESLQDQERCMRLFLTRLPSLDPAGLEASYKHREVIRRFGRFPSRNAALGRQDTPAELAYRAEGGYMSGAPGAGPG
ncbi:MAG: DUF924 family protein [Pseudomonadota bacterium]